MPVVSPSAQSLGNKSSRSDLNERNKNYENHGARSARMWTYKILRSYLIRANQPRMPDCITITALSRFFSDARSSRAAFVLSKNVVFIDSFAANILLVAPPHNQTPHFLFFSVASQSLCPYLVRTIADKTEESRISNRTSHNRTLAEINTWRKKISNTSNVKQPFAKTCNFECNNFSPFILLQTTPQSLLVQFDRNEWENENTALFHEWNLHCFCLFGVKFRCWFSSLAPTTMIFSSSSSSSFILV